MKKSLHLVNSEFSFSEEDTILLFLRMAGYEKLMPVSVSWKEPIKTPYSQQALRDEFRKMMGALLWKNKYLNGGLFKLRAPNFGLWLIIYPKQKSFNLVDHMMILANVLSCDFAMIFPLDYGDFDPNKRFDEQSDEVIRLSDYILISKKIFASLSLNRKENLQRKFNAHLSNSDYILYSKIIPDQ